MTQSSKPYQNKDKDKDKDAKSSREIESEIGETRSAISGDIKALNDKFSPANIKEQTKEVMGSVKDAAVEQAAEIKDVVVDKVIEVKDAVVDKAVEVKDAVVETAVEVKDAAAEKIGEAKDVIVETMQDVGEQAARAGAATWRFTKANAIPLALVGMGAGWMIANSRRSSARRLGPGDRTYRGEAWEDDTERYDSSMTPRPRAASELGQRGRTTGYAPGNGSKSKASPSKTKRLGAQAHDMIEKAGDSAQRAERKLAAGAARSGKYVQEKFQVARTATSDFAAANPLLVAMATLAAGIGIGMLLPSTEREDKLLAPSRAKFSHLLGDVREAATDVAQVAKDTANDSLQAMT